MKDLRLKQLEQELLQTKEDLCRATQELEASKAQVEVLHREKRELEEAVFHSRDFSDAVIANIHEPVLVLDDELRVIKASKLFYNTFEVTQKETEGILAYNLGNNQWNIASLRKLLEEILPQRKKITNYEVTHLFPGIGERTMLLNAYEIRGNSQSEKLILLAIKDITGIKESDNANAKLAAIVASSEDAIISKTLEGIITSWNSAAERLFGYTSDEIIGQSILKVIPDDRIDEEPEIIRKISQGETIAHFETQRLAKSGKLIDISLTISPIKDTAGNITGASKIARDISEQIAVRKQMEESEKRFHNLIFSSPSAIAILDGPDYIITTANEPVIEIWGKGRDVIGKKFFDLLPELEEQGFREIYDNVYTAGTPYNAIENPVRILQKGEPSVKYYNFILYPQHNLDNEIIGIGIIASDVTVQALYNKSIRESEERFRSLTETLPQLIWVTDGQGNAEFASSRWKEYSGIDPDGEKAWNQMLHPDERDYINNQWAQSLITGQIYKSEVRLKNKAGEFRWHSVGAEAVRDADNKIVKWIGAFTDIHDQKIKEEKKDEFLGIASHEMKTPLTTAKAYLQMLEISLDESVAQSKLFASKASDSVDRLNELISELLDVSKIQFGKLNYSLSTFDFNEMIGSTIENLQLTSPTCTIVKSGSVSDPVQGDKNRLQQVVINLLSNAIKYSPHCEEVFITLAQQEDIITVSVKDMGIGIADDNLTKIFDKYHRVEEHAVEFQGMGVGLYISHEIITRHGGRLWAESELGKGSTFYFTLPVNNT